MIVLKRPRNREALDLLTDTQIGFLESDRASVTAQNFDYLNLKKTLRAECSMPEEICFEWDAEGEGILQISESETFETCHSEVGKNFVKVTNLKCGTRYFWRVVCGDESSDVFYFDTADRCPRFLKVDGMTNVRDCGGWKCTSGKRIRQGLLYRGSEMNSHVTVTESGLKTLKDVLKIKGVLDLRGEKEEVRDVYQAPVYCNVPAKPYGEWFQYPELAREMFEFIFNEDHYPLYFHCWGGADRTGTLAFLIGALLGQSDDDLLADYEITTLSIWGVRSRNTDLFKSLLAEFNGFPGKTAQEKAENYLLSCGISKASIENFQNFMLS